MAMERESAANRVALGAFGAAAGLCLWYLFESYDAYPERARPLLFFTATAVTFFGGALAMTGPLTLPRALLRAAPLGVLAGGLLWWSSLGYDRVDAFLNAGHPMAAYFTVSFLALPFLIAAAGGPGGWRDHAALFRHSWSIVVRSATAWLFLGIFWLVYFLSDALLNLVDLETLSDMAELGWFAFTLSGLVLALALAVLNDMAAFMSPSMVLRLLRLLVPVLAVVVAIFLAMVPVRGLGNVFGSLSSAATLLATALGAVTLISSAVGEDDARATDNAPLLGATQALALMLPVLVGLAGWAIWQRVGQYGWTPNRLVAALSAAVLMLYALLYAVTVLRRRGWMARIRAGNTRLALSIILLSVLWLTPVLDAERISAASQVARFQAGKTSARALDLWAISQEWGRAGEAAIDRFAAMTDHPEYDVLAARLERLAAVSGRREFEAGATPRFDRGAAEAALVGRLRVFPAGTALPDGFAAALEPDLLEELSRHCDTTLADGAPGCAVLLADFVPDWEGEEAMFFLLGKGRTGIRVRVARRGMSGYGNPRDVLELGGRLSGIDPDELIAALKTGRYSVGAPGMRVLRVEGLELMPRR